MDLDWSVIGSAQCAVVFHGLEGHSDRSYMQGMVRACNRAGWDSVAVNLRGCSGEPNRLPKSYHQGSSDDCATVVTHVAKRPYKKLVLIGFSLGANIILKYLGEGLWDIPETVIAAAAVSTPCDLASCAHNLARRVNAFYMRRFLVLMHRKLIAKKATFPTIINNDGFGAIRTFKEFDDRYTAPLFGFKNAEDYWEKCSSIPVLPAITLPSLMLGAKDDPFLTPACFPLDIARSHKYLTLEVTRYGGHVGFMGDNRNGNYWHEQRVVDFIHSINSH
jgi:predicted alpha/beta-fold hydrolase